MDPPVLISLFLHIMLSAARIHCRCRDCQLLVVPPQPEQGLSIKVLQLRRSQVLPEKVHAETPFDAVYLLPATNAMHHHPPIPTVIQTAQSKDRIEPIPKLLLAPPAASDGLPQTPARQIRRQSQGMAVHLQAFAPLRPRA